MCLHGHLLHICFLAANVGPILVYFLWERVGREVELKLIDLLPIILLEKLSLLKKVVSKGTLNLKMEFLK